MSYCFCSSSIVAMRVRQPRKGSGVCAQQAQTEKNVQIACPVRARMQAERVVVGR
jgi:hypothetical protein